MNKMKVIHRSLFPVEKMYVFLTSQMNKVFAEIVLSMYGACSFNMRKWQPTPVFLPGKS